MSNLESLRTTLVPHLKSYDHIFSGMEGQSEVLLLCKKSTGTKPGTMTAIKAHEDIIVVKHKIHSSTGTVDFTTRITEANILNLLSRLSSLAPPCGQRANLSNL